MVFVDGENLTKRYGDLRKQRDKVVHLDSSQWYMPDVFLWSEILNGLCSYLATL